MSVGSARDADARKFLSAHNRLLPNMPNPLRLYPPETLRVPGTAPPAELVNLLLRKKATYLRT
jgi:hypothetical protein